jgi:hypothetical protein
MKPARAKSRKDFIPIDVAALELRNRRMAAVRAPHRGSYSKSSLREVQSIAYGAANAVVRNPTQEGSVNATLQDAVFNQPPYGILRERRDHSCSKAEASPQTTRDVVFSTALGDAEVPRRVNPVLRRIESQHDLSQAKAVPAARIHSQVDIVHVPLS